jgi:hypothetical protein
VLDDKLHRADLNVTAGQIQSQSVDQRTCWLVDGTVADCNVRYPWVRCLVGGLDGYGLGGGYGEGLSLILTLLPAALPWPSTQTPASRLPSRPAARGSDSAPDLLIIRAHASLE